MKTIKTILKYLFGVGTLGLVNPVLWLVAGCVTPLIGMLFGSDTFSKPVNPAALVFWSGAVCSIIYNVITMLSNDKTKK